jgi:membrane-bound metal-dependent hydrolase YbcI (DUF457 family)
MLFFLITLFISMMDPHEHLLIALVMVLCYIMVAKRELPSIELLAIAFVGSQLPDLIDKPLAIQLDVIPTGRVFMHSLPVAIPVWMILLVYTWRTERPHAGVAFVIAYASHLVGDNYRLLAAQQVPNNLLWPFRPHSPLPDIPYWAGPHNINVHLVTLFSIAILTTTIFYLILDINDHMLNNG